MPLTKPRSSQVSFDPSTSTLVSTDAQSAIEELEGQLQTSGSDAAALTTRVDTLESEMDTEQAKTVEQDGRLDAVEATDVTQDGRLDALETFQASADGNFVNEVGEESITGSLTVDQVKIDGNSITTADASNLTLGETGETVIIPGNLSVSGTTTTVDSNEVNIGDAVIRLNSDLPDNTAPTEDGGFEVYRGTGTGSEPTASLVFQESTDSFVTSIDGGTTFRTIAYADELTSQGAAQQAAIDQNAADIASNDTDIANLGTEQTSQGTRITTLEGEMDAVEAANTTQDGRLTTLETRADETDTEQAAQDTAIAGNSSRLDALEATAGTRSVTGNYSLDQYSSVAVAGTTYAMTRAATPQFTNVTQNGVTLIGAGVDYTASGTNIVLTEATVVGDSIRIEAFDSINV